MQNLATYALQTNIDGQVEVRLQARTKYLNLIKAITSRADAALHAATTTFVDGVARTRLPTAKEEMQYAPDPFTVLSTHNVPVIAQFRPVINMIYHYHSTTSSNSNSESAKFDIPVAGDFIHDACFHAVIDAPRVTYTTNVKADRPLMRWCDYPGERLIKSATITIGNSDIDRYEYESVVLHRNFRVGADRKLAWDRCVGQEVPRRAFLKDGASEVGGGVRIAVEVTDGPQTPVVTLKPLEVYVPLRFWFCENIGYSFPNAAIANTVSRSIGIKLAKAHEMCNFVPRGTGTVANPNATIDSNLSIPLSELIFCSFTMDTQFISIFQSRPYMHLIRVHCQQVVDNVAKSASIQITGFKHPTEYLLIGARPSFHGRADDVSCRRSLSSWHKFHNVVPTEAKLKNFRGRQLVPIPLIVAVSAAGVVTSAATTTSPPAVDTLGYSEYTNALTAQSTPELLRAGDKVVVGGHEYTLGVDYPAQSAIAPASTLAWALSTDVASEGLVYLVKDTELTATYEKQETIVKTLGLGYGTNVGHYKPADHTFYSSYLPYRFSSHHGFNASEDPGAYYMPLSVDPTNKVLSSFINFSRVNQPFLHVTLQDDYDSITDGNQVQIVIVGNSLNFLSFMRGSAAIRFG